MSRWTICRGSQTREEAAEEDGADAFDLAVSIILISVGGGVAGVYLGQIQSILIAVQIGATAPAIIGARVSGGPPLNSGGDGPKARGGDGGAVALEKVDIASKVVRSLRWNVPD